MSPSGPPSPESAPTSEPTPHSPWAIASALCPVLGLTAGIPFANRLEPRIFGLPFLLAWIVGWILATPGFVGTAYWFDHRRPVPPPRH